MLRSTVRGMVTLMMTTRYRGQIEKVWEEESSEE